MCAKVHHSSVPRPHVANPALALQRNRSMVAAASRYSESTDSRYGQLRVSQQGPNQWDQWDGAKGVSPL